jgi:hypothetical protein
MWLQDQVNYHNLGTFTGIDGVYGRLTYEDGGVYIGHFAIVNNNVKFRPRVGDTLTRDGMQYEYQQNIDIGNILQGATLTAFFTEQNVPINNMPGILRVGDQEFQGIWLQDQVNYHNLGTYTGIDRVYGRLAYGDGDVYIGHVDYSDDFLPIIPEVGDTYTRNAVYTYRRNHIWDIIPNANLSGFFNNDVPLINGHIETVLRLGVFFPDEYHGNWLKDQVNYHNLGTFTGIDRRYGVLTVDSVNYIGKWIQEHADYRGTGGTFTGIDQGYGRLTVNDVIYTETWDMIIDQLQNNGQGQ